MMLFAITIMHYSPPSKDNMEQYFKAVKVEDELPETDSQHGNTFMSNSIPVLTAEGWKSASYFRTYDINNHNGIPIEQGWDLEGQDTYPITHWLKPCPQIILDKLKSECKHSKIIRYQSFAICIDQCADCLRIILQSTEPKQG